MNVTVIGAAGFVGRAVLANFAGRHEVRAFDTGPGSGGHVLTLNTFWSVQPQLKNLRIMSQHIDSP